MKKEKKNKKLKLNKKAKIIILVGSGIIAFLLGLIIMSLILKEEKTVGKLLECKKEVNEELMKQIESLLDIAQDSLINPEKYKKDVKNLLETYTIKRNQKEDKSSEEKQAPKEENKQENKPKEILKPIHTQTNEPITVNIDSISEKRDKESELDIEITEPIKGNVSMNTSLFINKKATQNENIEKDKIQETVKQHQFGLPISSNTLHQKPIPEKKEIKPQEEETEEIDVYDFMMNKKGSNAKNKKA